MTVRVRVLAAAAVAALALVLASAWLLARDEQPAQGSKARIAATAVVGEVTSLSGSKKIKVTPAGGKAKPLRDGDDLRLGDIIGPGAGVKATLKLTRPSSVPADLELVFVRATDGKEHKVVLDSNGTRTTTVTIGD